MRLSWALVLGATLGAATDNLAPRQQDATPSSGAGSSPSGSSGGGGSGNSPSSAQPSATGGSDVTVTVTTTVSGAGGGSTATQKTTVTVSAFSTVTVTSTDIGTTTVTSHDKDTATSTVYTTSTSYVNMKREIAEPTPAQNLAEPAPTITGYQGGFDYAGGNKHQLERRDTITEFVTVTAGGGGGATTVIETDTETKKSVTTSVVHTTSYITETDQANAKTTVTVTSTIVTRLTVVSTGVQTSTGTPTGSADNNNGGSGSGSGGLSTGAKAGIGAGVGVAGLAVIGIILFCCFRRRRGSKPDPNDLMAPASEVPVGGNSARPMSEHLSSTPGTAPRRSPQIPNVTPEGYRGTAMGDGRAGYAKPDPYGSAYNTAPSRSTTTTQGRSAQGNLAPGDQLPRFPTPDTGVDSVSPITASTSPAPPHGVNELGHDSAAAAKWHEPGAVEMGTDNPSAAKWHSDQAAEIDGQPALSHQSGPVYEMASEPYR